MSRTITIIVEGTHDAAKRLDERNKELVFKYCAPFSNCRSEINSIQLDNARDLDAAMPMYRLIYYTDNYSNTS